MVQGNQPCFMQQSTRTCLYIRCFICVFCFALTSTCLFCCCGLRPHNIYLSRRKAPVQALDVSRVESAIERDDTHTHTESVHVKIGRQPNTKQNEPHNQHHQPSTNVSHPRKPRKGQRKSSTARHRDLDSTWRHVDDKVLQLSPVRPQQQLVDHLKSGRLKRLSKAR